MRGPVMQTSHVLHVCAVVQNWTLENAAIATYGKQIKRETPVSTQGIGFPLQPWHFMPMA